MEDFGYQKDGEQNKVPAPIKKVFLIGATIVSIACFIYITISAYYFVYEDNNNSDIETIKAPEGPIKVIEDKQQAANSDNTQIDRTIYEDIFGNKKNAAKIVNPKIRNAPEPAIPPKINIQEPDRRLIKDEATKAAEVKKPAQNNDKIVVYSDQNKQEKPSTDLLTKQNGETKNAETAVKAAVQNKKRAVRVQVAAMTSKAAAEEYWDKLNHLYPSLFSGLKSFSEEVNLGKRGIFFRLQIGNFFNQVDAEEFCTRYVAQAKKTRADCIVVE